MPYGVLIGPPDPAAMAGLARASEAAGFDILALADSQSLFRELYVSMAVAAGATERIRLVPGVSNVVTRHLAVSASAIASLDELSGGRVALGIGTGDSALYNLGERPVSVTGMEEAVAALRGLFEGRTVSYRDRDVHVGWSRRRVPIYLAAEGPRMLHLAGQVADGVIVGSGLLPELIADARARLAGGAASAGRKIEDLDVWFFAKANLGEDGDAALDGIKMALAASANHAFRFSRADKGLPAQLVPAVERLQREYVPSQHEQVGPTRNAELPDELGLTDYLTDRFAVVGTAKKVVSRLQDLAAVGAPQVLLTALTPDPAGFLTTWEQEVAPELLH